MEFRGDVGFRSSIGAIAIIHKDLEEARWRVLANLACPFGARSWDGECRGEVFCCSAGYGIKAFEGQLGEIDC